MPPHRLGRPLWPRPILAPMRIPAAIGPGAAPGARQVGRGPTVNRAAGRRMRPRSSIKRGLVLAALVVGPALVPLPAWAATADRCQEDRTCKEQTDRAAQLAGQTLYEEALTLYQSAYDRFHEP